ncbi:secreted RxLR effector protein 161-like [Cicer arietinum]|uniref:Uncharacterized protein LOC113786687 n=1 Tax=Cicer arietinum TaxID=3827 RepID=A0A3Q7YFH9_CICAR|nr:uncharacterized protein LOC113786687 [Cicer arietinum]
MKDEFEMTDLGKLSYLLGMKFAKTEEGVLMHQKKYAREILRRFNMADCNPASIPMEINAKLEIEIEEKLVDSTLFKQVVGSLRYSCNTRPDICYSLGVVSRFMERPKHSHWLALKRIMRYIQGTIGHGIMFAIDLKHENKDVVGYLDSDWCGDKNDRRSTSRHVFKLMKSPVAWSSNKWHVISLSSCEVEYIVGSYAACQALKF